MALNIGITTGLKILINREQPCEKYTFVKPNIKEFKPSIPSGHTLYIFYTVTSLAL